jgi:TolA-binding protein
MRIIIMLFLLVSATSVHAEIYKCYTLKKVSYQPAPCSGVSESQDVVNVLKQSPQQRDEAQGRMNAMRVEQMEKQQAIQSQVTEQQKNVAVQQQLDDAQHAVAEAKQNADRVIRDAESAKQSADNARHAAETTSYNHDNQHHEYEPRSVITNSVTKSYGRAN